MTSANETNGRKRSSAMRRYGPLIAVVVVIAIVIAAVAIASGGGGGSSSNKSTGNNSGSTGVVMLNSSNRDSINWGPHCDTKTGKVAIPYNYAAPCVKPFTGNNGGATSDGVTNNSIKVVVYVGDPAKNPLQSATVENAGVNLNPSNIEATYKGYIDLFQKYYETYGRKVDVVYYKGTGAPTDEVQARADAQAIADMHPFAVLAGANQTQVWTDAVTAHHILCLGNCPGAVTQAFTVPREPYIWSYGPLPEQGSLLTADLIDKEFAGKDATFAGDTAMHHKKRVFGIVHYDTPDGEQAPAFAVLKNQLKKDGVNDAVDITFNLQPGKDRSAEISKLKQAGVTSVIYTGDPLTPTDLTKAATAQNYYPEWILGSNVLADTAVFARQFDQKQWAHAVGIALLNPARTDQSANPGYLLYKWFTGSAPPSSTYGVILPDPTILFTGIQLAGPHLTANTFKDGLFSSPVLGGTPLSPRVSRGNHGLWPGTDWGGSDDAGLIWWNPNATGQDEIGHTGKGLYEYVQGGKRYTYGNFPTSDPGFFDPKTSVTIYTSVPPSMAPPSYPSPAGQ
jgi:hypothetical protein